MTADSPHSEQLSIEEKTLLRPIEPVQIIGDDDTVAVRTRIDTGSGRACIDRELAADLGLDEHVDDEKNFSGADSSGDTRALVKVSFVLRGEVRSTKASLKDRSHLGPDFRLGRRELGGFLVDPAEQIEP